MEKIRSPLPTRGVVIVLMASVFVTQSAFTQPHRPERKASQSRPLGVQTLSGPNDFAMNLVRAIAKPELTPRILQATYTGVEGQAAIFASPLQEFPRSGSQYVVLSTGISANTPGTATTFSSVDMGGISIPGGSPDNYDAYDVATLKVRLNLSNLPADPEPRLVFRYKFSSEEPPTYWGSQYQDYFTAVVRNSDGQVVRNIAILPNTLPFTIDNARPFMNQVTGSSQTPLPPYPTPNDVVFNASTGIHTTDFGLAGMIGEVIDLEFQIGDVGDGVYDSGIFIDGLEIQAGPLPDFRISQVEFNQASQTFGSGQSVAAGQLVAAKSTTVRVSVVGENNDPDPKQASAALHMQKNGIPIVGSPFRPSPLRVTPLLNPSRTARDGNDRPTQTLQFHLPGSATSEQGDYHYYIAVDPDNEVDEADETNNRFPTSGYNVSPFHAREDLRVLLVRVTTVDRDGQVVQAPTPTDDAKFIEQRLYAKKILPRNVSFTFADMTWNVDATSGWLWWQKNIGDLSTSDGRSELFSRILDMMEGHTTDLHTVVAILPCATNIGANGWGYQGRPGAIVKTCVISTLTHELAHNWLPANMFNPPDPGHDPTNSGDDGLWVGPDVKLKLNKANILHVGSDDPWVSPNSYRALFENFALGSEGTQFARYLASESPTNALRITGWIDEEGDLVVRPIHTVESSAFTSDDPAGEYLIEFLGEHQTRLETLRFTPPVIPDHDGPPSPGPFSIVVPRPEGLENIVFKAANLSKFGMYGLQDSALGTIPVSANPPTVFILFPSGGETFDQSFNVEWEGNDLDGDSLFYTVQYTPDGTNFIVLATMLTGTSFQCDASQAPGGTNAAIRVIVTDGVNTASGVSGAFTLAGKPPHAVILSPKDGAAIQFGGVAGIEGEAHDLEDGQITGEQLHWYSDIDGFMGSGESISTTVLSVGTHIIVLNAIDNDGNIGADSITFHVIDTTPDSPTSLEASAGDGQVSLSWNASTSGFVAGYKVYRGTASGSYGAHVVAGNVTSHVVTNLTNAMTYYFALTAYDALGNESGFSNEVQATPTELPLPNQVILSYPPDGAAFRVFESEAIIHLAWHPSQPAVLGYQLDIANDAEFDELVLSDTDLSDSTFVFVNPVGHKTYFWRVRGRNATGHSPFSNTWSFTIMPQVTVEVPISLHWNLVSLPVSDPLPDDSMQNVYPTSVTPAGYAYSGGGYIQQAVLEVGRGYWMRSSLNSIQFVTGTVRATLTIAASEGWNLIGSISDPVAVSSIESHPPGIVTSRFFGYLGSYHRADTVYPGNGYWVKVSESGQLILSSDPAATNPAARIQIQPTSEMPPPPPDGDIPHPTSRIPTEFALEQNYPNPFNPVTVIRYQLPSDVGGIANPSYMVSLKVYDVLGRVVATLVDEVQEPGYKSVEWDASGVASAVYFYRMEATSVDDASRRFSQVRKMLLLR